MNLSISGRICSGKSAIAHILRDKHGYTVTTIAEPLYTLADLARAYIGLGFDGVGPVVDYLLDLTHSDNVNAAYNAFLEQAWHHGKSLLDDEKPRGFLQDLGTALRAIDGDIFVRAAVNKAQAGKIVVDDLRMVNEATAFRQARFKLVRIDVDEAVRMQRVEELGYDKNRLSHITETALDDWTDWDYRFDGGCGKDELEWQVSAMLDLLKG